MASKLIRLLVLVALVAAAMAAGGCDRVSPIGPSDPPPPPPSPPAVSSLELKATYPGVGSTLRASVVMPDSSIDGDQLTAVVSYNVSPEDLAEAVQSGDDVAIIACISIDGTGPILRPDGGGGGGCFVSRVGVSPSGETSHMMRLLRKNTDTTQTGYLILSMEWRRKDNAQPYRVFLKKVVPATFNWR